MDIILFLLLIVFIIVLSGIISGSEAAILSISYTKVKDLYNNTKSKDAENLLKIKEDLQKYITTIVVLNNLVNIIGSIYVGVIASKLFGEFYLGLVSALLTFLIIMFSEIIPKVYGENHSKEISLRIASSLIFITKLFSPVIFILNKISSFFVRGNSSNSISEGEIREMAILGEKEGSINTYESDVINNVFKMDELQVYDIMVPKSEVVLLDIDTNYDEIIKITQESGFTRFPVRKDDEIIGIINVKDLFKYYNKENKFHVSKILRPVFYIPETSKIFTLEERFKKEKTHMAIIVNEHGDFTGIVTLEDVIEELLGEIEDEFDKEGEKLIEEISNNKYRVMANIDINELNENLNLNLDEYIGEDYSTLNGFLVEKLGKIPRVNNKVKLDNVIFRVIKASKKKAIEVEILVKDS